MSVEQHTAIAPATDVTLGPGAGQRSDLPFARSRLRQATMSRFTPRIETLRLVGGLYLIILGMSFLLLPQGSLGIWLRPIWVSGAGLVAAGLATLWLAVVTLPRRVISVIALIFALPPVIITITYLFLGAILPAITLGLFTLSLLLAPFAPPDAAPDTPRPDALGLVLGMVVLVQGIDFLTRSASAAALLNSLGLSELPIGLIFVCSGGAVIVVQLLGQLPAIVRWIAHLACGMAVLGLLAGVALVIDSLYWVLGAAVMLRGVATLALPWMSERVARVHATSFRPRLALALMTAALLPVGIALPLVIATIPQSSPALALAQQVAFGSTMLVMLLSSIGGWWLAGNLSRPLTRLMRGVNRIAAGQHETVLDQQGVVELASLSRAVEQMARTLEGRAEERALLLALEQAARAEKEQALAEAREAVRVRDAFISVAAHELKNPLTALLGNAQLVERRATQAGTLAERDQRTLRSIIGQGARLNQMIATLLDASRIEAGQLHIEQAPVDISALTHMVVDELEPTLVVHRIIYEAPDRPLVVSGDELRLMQVIRNLVENAIKYSPRGGTVMVRIEASDQQVCVSVSDEGIGIPDEALPHLFRRFYRAGNAEATGIGGIGVGLYVVKEIVTRHGGEVTVTSSEGRGSTFRLCLPLLPLRS